MAQQPARRAARPAPQRSGGRGAERPTYTKPRSATLRGEEGRARVEQEILYSQERAEARRNGQGDNKPFRFYTPVGESRQVIVCDDEPSFFFYEHALRDEQGRYNRVFSGCTKAYDICPVCATTGRESYYALALTIIDLTEFETKNGVQTFSRKLLIVKPQQQKKFLRIYDKEGSLRGALLTLTRDGETDASIGGDIEFEQFVDDDEFYSYVRTWKDRENKTHTENCYEVYDYDTLFPEPDQEELRALVGAAPAEGSRQSNRASLDHQAPRSAPRGGTPRGGSAARSAPAPRRGGYAEVDDPDDLPFDPDSEYEDANDTRVQGRTAGRSAAPAPRRGAPPTQEADYYEDADDPDAPTEAPPARRGAARPPASVARPSTPARRPRSDSSDFDDDPEQAPARRSSVPARRGR